MKKVLALALALVMVCTMALAVNVNIVPGGDNAATTPAGDAPAVIAPGTTLYFSLDELAAKSYGVYYDADGEFVPEKNKVTVTYGKGAELVKSAGWVETTNTTCPWQYQIVLKDAGAETVADKTVDFSITKVAFKAYGFNGVEYKYDDAKEETTDTTDDVIEFDYGWNAVKAYITASKTPIGIGGFNTLFDLGTVYTLNAVKADLDQDGKEEVYSKNTWVAGAANYKEIRYDVAAGNKILRKNFPNYAANNAWMKKYGFNELGANDYTVEAVNDTNLTGTGLLAEYADNYADVNFYAVAIDGSVSKIALTVNDGVATFKVPAYTAVVSVNGTLKNVGSTIGATEVTNPGTGANDVVGIAAALAVVALTSAAAISLKK